MKKLYSPPSEVEHQYVTNLYGIGSEHIYTSVLENAHNHWKEIATCPNKDCSDFVDGRILIHEDTLYGLGFRNKKTEDLIQYYKYVIYYISAETGGPWQKITDCCVLDFTYWNGYFYGVGTDYKVYR